MTAKDDGFTATAEFYSNRPGYPPEAIRWIVDRLALDGRGRMLDVGCGTGHVCFCFAGEFDQIIGIDPSQQMLNHAKSIARERGLSEYEFLRMKAEDLPADLGRFRLISFGASFHRTDQEQTLNTVYDMLEPKGGLALLFPSVPWRGEGVWKEALREVVKEWTGTTLGGPFEPSQNVVRRSRFRDCAEHDFRERHIWTLKELTGYLKSTSFCSPAVVGERIGEFGRDLANRLLKVQPDAEFHDEMETTVVLSVKAPSASPSR